MYLEVSTTIAKRSFFLQRNSRYRSLAPLCVWCCCTKLRDSFFRACTKHRNPFFSPGIRARAKARTDGREKSAVVYSAVRTIARDIFIVLQISRYVIRWTPLLVPRQTHRRQRVMAERVPVISPGILYFASERYLSRSTAAPSRRSLKLYNSKRYIAIS